MIHISLRNKARHTRTREPGSVVIILMKIPHVRASFDSFHPGKMFVTHFSHRKRSNAVLPGVQKGRVGKKKRGGTGGEKRRENPVFYLNTVSRAVYANVYNIYNNFIARISNNATEIKGSYKNFYTSLQQENSFPRFHEL